MDGTLHQLIKVAKLYYEDGLTQQAIAERLRLSRPKISRLLQQARDDRIVQITIAPPFGTHTDLERQLETCYGLEEALVVDVTHPDASALVMRELGAAAADYFSHILQDHDIVGLTWGGTLAAMVDALSPQKFQGVRVVQMVGGLGEPSAEIHATDVARRMAQTLDASLTVLPAPGIVDNSQGREILQMDKYVRNCLQLAAKANVVLAGIGALKRDSVLMRDGNLITWDEVSSLISQGAVGDIALRFFDIHGRPVAAEINERVLGVDLPTLKSLPRVIGVAGGSSKFEAILGAVRGKLVNSLVTDSATARQLLKIAE